MSNKLQSLMDANGVHKGGSSTVDSMCVIVELVEKDN